MNVYITEPAGVLPASQIKNMRFLGEAGMNVGFKRISFTGQPISDFPFGIGDILILQLPTGMGADYEKSFIHSFFRQSKGRLVTCFHSVSSYETGYDLSCADTVIVSTKSMEKELKDKSFIFSSAATVNLSVPSLLVAQKLLLNTIEPFYSDTDIYPVHYSDSLVQVVFALHDKSGIYAANIGTVILSICQHTSAEICFHILADETLTNQNRYKLLRIASDYGNHICFHSVNKSQLTVSNEWLNIYSVGSLFRLQIPNIFTDFSKVIYLDSDLLFCRDIEDLWNIDMADNALAGVNDIGIAKYHINSNVVKKNFVSPDEYINSGVLMMNLDIIRSIGNLQDMTMNFIKGNLDLTMPDQDALNVIFKDRILLIDSVWNCLVKYERVQNQQLENKVYHFIGQSCIIFSEPTEYERELLKTSGMTPWGEQLIECNYFSGLYSAYDKIDMLEKLLAKASAPNIRRFFYGYNSLSMRTITAMLNIDSDDCFISQDPIDNNRTRFGIPVKNFDEISFPDKGTFIVLVLPDADSGAAISNLNSSGLVNGEDYFVIPRLLTTAQGGYVK